MVSKPKMFLFLQLLILSLTYAIQSKMKISQLLRLSIFSLLLFMIACNSEDTVTTLSTDAQITSFSLTANDTVLTNLDDVFFTIDQNKEEIFNADSLPVGTTFTKLLAEISFSSASKATIRYASGDTLNYSSTDPIDFTGAFKIEVVAYDGVTSKTYNVKLNVHKQEPDSMQWTMLTHPMWNLDYSSSKTIQFNNQFLTYFETVSSKDLYTSSVNDGNIWKRESLTGFPADALINTITEFNGKLYMSTSGSQLFKTTDGKNWTLASAIETGFITPVGVLKDQNGIERLIVERIINDTYYLAYTTDGLSFSICGDLSLPADFPIKNFSTINSPGTKYNKLSVIGGIAPNGDILSSLHQLYWDRYGFHIAYNLNNNNITGYSGFAKRKGAMAYYYDNKMMLSGGNTADTTYNDVFTSIDNGISWQRQDSLLNHDSKFSDFKGRADASTYVDPNNNVWVFGGIGEGGTILNEVWRGKINRLGFLNK